MGTYRHLVRSEENAPEIKDVTSVLASGGFYVIQCVDHGYSVNDQVILTGFVENPTINGTHTVSEILSSFRFKINVAASGSPTTETGFVQLVDGTSYTEVYPLGFITSDFDYKKNTDRVYFKKIFSGDLVFTNRPAEGVTDYDFFLNIESNFQCTKVKYVLQKFCNNDWADEWEAYFSVTDGHWDKDKCIFKVKPIPDDNIECMEQKLDLNILAGVAAVTTYYKAGSIAARNYENTRTLEAVLDYLATETCSRIHAVISDFFQINPENPSDINYVTGEDNPYKSMTIGMKVDIYDPIPSDLQTEGITSFQELMAVLNTLFNVWWTIEGDFVRIEHISYFEAQAGLDLTQARYDKWTRNTNKYTYDKKDLPNIENFTYTDKDEVNQIVYDTYCQNSIQQIKNYSTGNYSVNLYGLRNAQWQIKSTEGFVLMATEFNSGTGKYDVIGSQNDELFPSKLLLKFYRHNRSSQTATLILGSSSYGDFFIYSSKKTKKQDEFTIELCCDDEFVDTDYMTTALGKGHLSSAKFNIKSDTMKVQLLYGDDDLPEIEPDDLSGLAFWVKGDDANAAGAISSWTDQSGNGRHATQATGSKQPTKVLDVVNGLPIIRFDGTDDGLATSAFQTFPSKRGTVFIVWKNYQPINTADDHLVGTYGSGSGNMWDIGTQYFDTGFTLKAKVIHSFAYATDLKGVFIASPEADIVNTYPVGDYGYTGFVLGCLRRDADASIHFSTNGLGENTIAIADLQPASNPLNIGNSFIAGNSNPFKGDIAEIIIYDRDLTWIEKQRVDRYLINKYALFPYS